MERFIRTRNTGITNMDIIMGMARDYHIHIAKIVKQINHSNERNANVVKNIVASFGIKGISIVISLLLVPLTINYVNPTQYGVWLTLSSIVAWFSFFNIGFGYSLQNRFAEAKATGAFAKAKAYISTTYICLSAIFTIVWIFFFCINFFIDWHVILNAPKQMAKDLSLVAVIVVSFFCIQIVLKTINTVLVADQRSAKSAFFDMLGQLLALIIIFTLTKTTSGSLLHLALALGFPPILIMIISSLWLYNHEYKQYRPSIYLFDKKIVTDILTLGVKFFIAQIAALLIYQSANIIIAQLFTPESVTEYNVAYKYFNLPYMLLVIILTPLWSAYTEAYVKKDTAWMFDVLKKIRYFFIILMILSILMLVASPVVYHFWIGDAVEVPFMLSLSLCIYTILYMWVSVHVYFINGIGKVRLQYFFSIGEIILYIPLSLLLGSQLGVSGVVLAMVIFMAIRSVWSPIQLNKLIRGNSHGIWNQ
jgi:O-antigen/teichoic acid export membrane protein